MFRFRIAALAGALALALPAAAADTAAAGGYPLISPYLYGASPYIYSQARYDLPYFSLYPPVYYSHPVARPYGLSPFASPFGPIPEVVMEPEMIVNPHVEAEETATSERVARHPGRVQNPYVKVSSTATASNESSQVSDAQMTALVEQLKRLPSDAQRELIERLAD